MDRQRIDNLTPGMKACLALVLEHKSSKQIALELRISHHTVDDRIKEAMRILGVSSRVDAAKLLETIDTNPPQPLGPQSAGVVGPIHHALPSGRRTIERTEPGQTLPDESDTELSGIRFSSEDRLRWPFPTTRRPYNDLGFWERITWIALLSVGTIGLLFILVAGLKLLVASLAILSDLKI